MIITDEHFMFYENSHGTYTMDMRVVDVATATQCCVTIAIANRQRL
jgi:hypothetical protein